MVYPEGHRYKEKGYLPLKTGVMEVAYNLHIPCQAVITLGKEDLIDEINLKMNKNQQLITCVSEVMNPTDFKTKEEWFEHVRKVWDETYKTCEKKEGLKQYENALPGLARYCA